MTEDEGSQLFLSVLNSSHVGDEFETDRLTEVTRILGNLPLAINQVANFMVERYCTIEDFLEIYTESMQCGDGFTEIDTETPNLFYAHTLATVWRISIQRLSSASTTLLSILSCLDPDGIPEAMMRQGARGATELAFLASAKSYSNATSELLRNGLIWKRNRQTLSAGTGQSNKPSRGVSLHRLVQDTVFHQQSTDERAKTFSQAVHVCLNAFPHPTRTNFRLMDRWAECESTLPHLLALESRCESTPELDPNIELAELFLYAGWYLYERRAPEVAIPLLNRARAVAEKENSVADWFLKSRILSAFGCVLFECSRYTESERYFRDALTIRLDNVSPDDILLAHGYQDTALSISGQGRFQEAIELQKKALEIVEKNEDDFTRRDMMFHIHHNMARTYEAAGNAGEALRLHLHQGDEFGNGLRREMSESGAVNLYAIGNCHLALGNQERGIHYHSRALKIRLQLVGEQGFYYGISQHKMGCILKSSGAVSAAVAAFETAERIFANSLDAQREHSRTLYNLSSAERDLGRHDDAKRHLDLAWELRTQITGDVRPSSDDFESSPEGFDRLVIYIHA